MNNRLIKISVYLNIFMLVILAFLNYKLGLLDDVLAAGHPVTHNNQNKSKPSLRVPKKDSGSYTGSVKDVQALATLQPQPAQPSLSVQLTDDLTSKDWWHENVNSQVKATQNSQHSGCIFGDSISSGLGNTLGEENYNFAIGGMSTVSLLEQLRILNAANVKCSKAIIAIGTNDALYSIENQHFSQNMKAIVAKVKAMGATKVILIPAFYSTVEASLDPSMAGTIDRVEEINRLIYQVAEAENVSISGESIQPLFEGQSLKGNLTSDGVHLNADGKKIYRQALLEILRYSV